MLTSARRKMVEELAARDGEIVISALARELGVSIETIRRDINALSAEGKLIKVHGGAMSTNQAVTESRYEKRRVEGSDVKAKLGQYAAGLIGAGEVVTVSAGSTMEAVARCLRQPSMVVTNSLAVADILRGQAVSGVFGGKCVLLGGEMNPEECMTCGPIAAAQLAVFHTDAAIISASAICRDELMTTGIEEGTLQGQMIEAANRVILVAHSAKFGPRSIYRFATLGQVNEIVTDGACPLDEEMMKLIRARGIRLHLVEG